jgi:hypothetical protein
MLMKKFTPFIKVFSLTIACLLCFSFNSNAATILSETFATSLGNFTKQSLLGDSIWNWTKYGAKITGYDTPSKTNFPNDDWLISPSMDFSDVTKANLSFDHAHRFGANPNVDLTLMVSTSYTGGTIDTTKWTSIAFTHSDQTTWTFLSSGLIALDAYAGKENVRFALRFKSSATASATWEVKNVLVESVVNDAPKTVLEENFDKATAGNTTTPGTYDIMLSTDSIAKYIGAGWTGSKVYSSGGEIKMGSSSALGYIVTPSLDLSGNSGNFTLYLDARAWSGDATSIKIYVNDVLVKQVDGLSNAAAPYICSSFGPFTLSGGTATTKIKFEGLQAAKGRFFLDNLKITQGSAAAASATLTSASFSVENGSTQTKNLILKGSNVTSGLAVIVTNKVGTAFSTTAHDISAAQANDTTGFVIPVKYAPSSTGKDTAEVSVVSIAITDVNGDGKIDSNDNGLFVSAVVSGQSWSAVSVANLAALRAAYDANTTDATTVYKITGEVLVNYTNISGNSKYLQDATGGAMIYDTKGLVTTTFAIGDGMKDLKGTLTAYGKLLEIVPVADVAVSSTGNTITAKTLTIPEVKANIAKYESTLIQINNLTCGKTGNFSTAKANYNFGNGTDTIAIRTNYTGMDYMGTAIPTGATNIRGILIQYNGTAQLVPRSLTDFGVPASLQNVTKTTAVYGSDGILNVEANQGQTIEVYNILGRKVMSAVANEGTNTFSVGRDQILLVKVGNLTSKIVL